MRLDALNASLRDGTQSENARLALDPLVAEQALLQQRQQRRQNFVAKLHSQYIQRCCTALAQVPAACLLVIIKVVVVVVVILVVHIVVLVKVGVNTRARTMRSALAWV